MKTRFLLAAISAASLLAACGGGGSADSLGTVNNNPARGALVQSPVPRITSLSAADLTASLQAGGATGQGLLAVAGAPTCGVDVQYMQYGTVGGKGEATDASGALFTPTGGTGCSGARPILLYAHGTNISKRYNLADLSDKTNPAYSEAITIATMYAAQGYIVVAPNYAGYDSSKLSYHPYLNADQQSKDMMDALAAARAALPKLLSPVSDNGRLFINGYSQGGHVAMATFRAMLAAGQTVTAAAGMSGPYALASFGDAVYYGNVNLGSTIFTPLLINSYQKSYNNIYTNLTDIYEPAYATGIDTLMPGPYDFTSVVTSGKVPQTALFSSTPPAAPFAGITPIPGNPLSALGFGTSNLITNAARLAFLLDAQANPDGVVPAQTTGLPPVSPANPMRIAAKLNDLRNPAWVPNRPFMMCGGANDPTVFYPVNTQVMQGFFTAVGAGALMKVVNVDQAATVGDGFDTARAGFAQAKTSTATAAVAAGATDGGVSAVTQSYHGSLVPPFCNAAARGFFASVP